MRIPVCLALALMLLLASFSGCIFQPKVPNGDGNNNGWIPQPPERSYLFNSTNAYNFIADQCNFGYRIPGTENNTECAQWIFDKLEEYNFTAEWQNFTGNAGYLNGTALHNVIGTKKGTTNATLVLAAHYDTRPWADMEKASVPVMGANDGGSGVAVLLELARLLASQNFTITIKMMFFDAEDSGNHDVGLDWCLGSKYVASLIAPEEIANINKCGFVLLDMVGDKNLSLPKERISNESLQNIIWNIAYLANITQFKNATGWSITDDHVPFKNAGVKAIDIIHTSTPPAGPVFPATWHTTRDTIENISKESLGAVGMVVERTIYMLDGLNYLSIIFGGMSFQ
ncbi:MAG: M28 family peptidase [Candidatus Thermoplasmatota archaeon]|nr:M28 family peptidase [Candidatus Thermoplasmatota archaeon]